MTWPAVRPGKAKIEPAGERLHGGSALQLSKPLGFQLLPLARFHDLGWIHSFSVHLDFRNLPLFIDQEGCASCCFVLRVEKAVFFGHIPAPVAQEREGNANLLCPRRITE